MWAAQSIVQELKAAEVLVKARGQEAALLQPLAKSLVHKIQGLRTNNAQELVVLYEAVQGSTLPEDCKSTFNNALDTVATAGVEMAAKTTMQPQAIDHVCNFLSKKDWEAISTQSMWAGASTIAMRLKKLNVQSLKESSRRWLQHSWCKWRWIEPTRCQVTHASTSWANMCSKPLPPVMSSLLLGCLPCWNTQQLLQSWEKKWSRLSTKMICLKQRMFQDLLFW